MKALLIKTSSLGDVIHTLPALSDARRALPALGFDWVIEEAYGEIAAWHPAVDRVIPVALRRWRRQPLQGLREWPAFRRQLRADRYAWVIDAQGLLKSALIAALARGRRYGLDRASAREPAAALLYRQRLRVARDRHAIVRLRQLFAAILGYTCPLSAPDYGLSRERFRPPSPAPAYIVFLHGTAWPAKHWPESHWIDLGRLANRAGYRVCLPWGDDREQARARRIASALDTAWVPSALGLPAVAGLLAGAAGVVGVDTGLSHLAAALEVPAVTLYGATHPGLTGAWGKWQRNLSVSATFPCAPCFSRSCRYRPVPGAVTPACYGSLPAPAVWRALDGCIAARRGALPVEVPG